MNWKLRWWFDTIKKYVLGGTVDNENMTITVGVAGKSPLSVFAENIPPNDDSFIRADGYGAPASAYSAADSSINTIVPYNGVVKNLRIISAAPGTDESLVAVVLKNGTPTSITATIAGTATSGSDLTHTASVNAGDLLTVKLTNSESSAADALTASLEIDPS